MPTVLAMNNTRANIPNIMITNSGGLRFDILKGTFTKNDQLTASPFVDLFLYIPNVTLSIASQVLPVLNGADAAQKKKRAEMEIEWWGRGYVEGRYQAWLQEMGNRASLGGRKEQDLTLGYVTSDVSLNSIF